MEDSEKKGLFNQFQSNQQEYQGNIETLYEDCLHGWVAYRDSSDPVLIDVKVEGEVVHRSLPCCLPRADLKQAGIHSGEHGYKVRVGYVTSVGSIVKVEIIDSVTKQLISKADLTSAPNRRATDSDDTSPRARCGISPNQATSPDGVMHIEITNDNAKLRVEGVVDNVLRGWFCDTVHPSQVLEATVLIDNIEFCKVKNDVEREDLRVRGLTTGHGGFEVRLPGYLAQTASRAIKVVVAPDVTEEVVWRSQPNSTRRAKVALGTRKQPVTVIVPVYNAYEDTKLCLERLNKYTKDDVSILLINDASTDTRIPALLSEYAKKQNFTAVTNEQNLGFTKTVNRGLELAKGSDVVFLNSDARVTPRWLEGLQAAAYSAPNVGTVTPLSDRAGAFSAPEIGNANQLPADISEEVFAVAVRRMSLRLYPSVPTGNGFCLYIKAECLREVGQLDEEAFPKGYGEENDFCMRAKLRGWKNVVDDATYVFHERSKSFGSSKTELMKQGRAVIDQRYPEYKKEISVFGSSEKLAAARFQVKVAQAACTQGEGIKPRALFVVSTTTGGTPKTNADLMGALSDAYEPWLLQSNSTEIKLFRVKDGEAILDRTYVLSEPVAAASHHSFEYDEVLFEWLQELEFSIVHIRHIAWHSVSLPKLAKSSGAAVVFSFHDFYTLCPTVKLLDQDNKYWGRGANKKPGGEVQLWKPADMPALDKEWLDRWQNRFAGAFAYCDAFVTTSASAKNTICAHLPWLDDGRFHVIPHGRDFAEFSQQVFLPRSGEPVRILVPGNIDGPKGSQVIIDILENDTQGLFEFHIVGNFKSDYTHPRLINHGSYKRENFQECFAKAKAHIGAIFSIWDETYCHTLTELWAAGYPVFAFDFGTIASRMANSGAGWIYDGDISDPKAILGFLKDICFSPVDLANKRQAVLNWQSSEGLYNTTEMMATRYREVYRNARGITLNASYSAVDGGSVGASENAQDAVVALVCPANRSLTSANASTHVRLWQRLKNDAESPVTYIRMTAEQLVAAASEGVVTRAIVQRNAVPDLLIDDLVALIESGKLLVQCDLDDDLLNVPSHIDATGQYREYSKSLRLLIEKAHVVTVSTATLKTRLESLNNNVQVEPNKLSSTLWSGFREQKPTAGALSAIYIGTATHNEDLALVLPALNEFKSSNPEFSLKLVGGVTDDVELPEWIERVRIPDHAKNYPGFVSWLQTVVEGCNLGIAPLQDSDFTRCKSDLKILDYTAMGLPVVASNTAVYREKIEQFGNVIGADNTEDAWISALSEISGNLAKYLQVAKQERSDGRGTWLGIDECLRSIDKVSGYRSMGQEVQHVA
ncbi:glycosyltransferase [Granulosicoccaceae sp. 1_MG-2023]|nr:glycosyltransferase [Granulosicoccaceae sp. 1_MG-2023]